MPRLARTRHTAPVPAADEVEDHDLGLSADLPRLVERDLGRRGLLGLLGGVGLFAAGCATVLTWLSCSIARSDHTEPVRPCRLVEE